MDKFRYAEAVRFQGDWRVLMVTLDGQRSRLPGTLSGGKHERQLPLAADFTKLMSEQGYELSPDRPLPDENTTGDSYRLAFLKRDEPTEVEKIADALSPLPEPDEADS